MFSYLSGRIAAKNPDHIVVDVQGVGYEVFVSFKTFQAVGDMGDMVKLQVHPIYREDTQRLYGFATDKEKKMFKSMIAISGIGPKVAMAALSKMSVDELSAVFAQKYIDPLIRIPGVGRKIAERLVVEMQDKVKVLPIGEDVQKLLPLSGIPVEDDVLAALVSLGYKEAEARQTLHKVRKNVDASVDDFQELMKRCLALV